MIIAGKTILVTGANRGIGRALAEEALNRGAKRVYAGTRVPLTHPDARVTPLTLDVTSAAQISKAAAFSMTQSLRALLAGRGVRVHAVLTGTVDTDMTRTVDIPKAPPESVARDIFDAVEKDEEDIFPGLMSQSLAEGWRDSAAKALERELAALAQSISNASD
jgi:NAD(P)-dependent dehydrogenase (short-subunit alcohol dehydrogenase family)